MEKTAANILVIEDDVQIRNFIIYSLEKEGYKVLSTGSGIEGVMLAAKKVSGIILLDLGLPDIDGFDVIRKIRKNQEVPIIVVSARDQDAEKVEALDLGADDYLTKPFSVAELLARIRVNLRHTHNSQVQEPKTLFTVGELRIDYEKHMVFLKEEYIHLTPLEYNMLELLSRNAGKILTTGYIIKELWGKNYGEDTRSLRTLMAGLRRKIEKVPAKPQYIITEVGVGYRMVDEL